MAAREAGSGSSGMVRETARERAPCWAHQVSSAWDPSSWPSVPWEGTEGILLGAHGFCRS